MEGGRGGVLVSCGERHWSVRAARAVACTASPALAALACLVPSHSAAATLRATGFGSALAHNDEGQPSEVLTPGPGSLEITVGVAASDAIENPTPPPANFEGEALGDAIGTARYGSLAGTAHAEASFLPANNISYSRALVNVTPGYTDVAEVLSDTLAPGTPVMLTFRMSLDAEAVHFVDPPSGVGPTGAGAHYEVELRDLDALTQPVVSRFLVIESFGTRQTSATLQLDTAIGHRVELVADLTVGARVDVDFAKYNVSQGSADTAAAQTAGLFYEPSGDVRLETESGHDYAVPEPGQATLLAFAAVLLLLRRER
jgi:hypothetical protein